MRECPECHELVGEQATTCFRCHAKLVKIENKDIPIATDEELVKDYSRRYYKYTFGSINILLVGILLNILSIMEIFYNEQFATICFLATCAAMFLGVVALGLVLKVWICPFCGSIKMHEGSPWEVTYHCCCRCGEHIRNHLEYSGKVKNILLLIIAGTIALFAGLCVYYNYSSMTGGLLDSMPFLTCISIGMMVIAIINLGLYLVNSKLAPQLFDD